MLQRTLSTLLLLILLAPFTFAKTDSIKLLAISGSDGGKGSIADIYLEVKPGNGNIFIDSFPLSKLDTQISTRFANQIACDFLKEDCGKYDFFYTIRAKASIVGGPSAGGAITILTISVLSDLKLDKKTVITGTINSGGLIGPVAGLNEKIEAAIENNFTTIIIPKWQSDLNLSEIEKIKPEEKIKIVKVKNIEEALYYFTGKDFSTKENNFSVPETYSQKMKEVSQMLCDRAYQIRSTITDINNSLYNISENFINKSIEAEKREEYYSRGSYCFSANIRLRELDYQNKSEEDLMLIYNDTRKELELLKGKLKKENLKTLSDLETNIIVIERLKDAEKYLESTPYDNLSGHFLAYSKERLFSAVAWSGFFDLKGKSIELDDIHLRTVCLKKTAEAEERINYLELYLPSFIDNIKDSLKDALESYYAEEYTQCIFKASKSKAEADILLTILTIREDELKNVILEKIEAIKKVIKKLEPEGIFPIIGYSYYEYSNSLIEDDLISSVTFAEYSLEFSRLDLYFPSKNNFKVYISKELIVIFMFGFLLGSLITMLTYVVVKKKNKTRR